MALNLTIGIIAFLILIVFIAVFAVRGRSSKKPDKPAERYEIKGRGAVVDNKTGLMWIKDGSIAISVGYPVNRNYNNGVNWQQARDLIGMLNTGKYAGYGDGFSDWRLPSSEELKVFLGGITFFHSKMFPNLSGGSTGSSFHNYWTGEEVGSQYANTVKKDKGIASQPKDSAYHHVWPVRRQ